ncbi:deoxynucleoside kinase [Candidatus Woesearchaeota archaeon]|nr:deoxynucleoside kinase [Candidatus Woesearchaeota archaeon]
MLLEDKITIALAGPIKSGKDILAAQAQEFRETLFGCLQGNYWVPQQLKVLKEEQDKTLFEQYSADPKQYAFEFQMRCLASRLEQQDKVDDASGLVLLGQPLEIDRHIYAEANREKIGSSFVTYENLHREVAKRVKTPDLWIYLRVEERNLDILLERIRENGRPGEKKFLDDPTYLVQNIRLNEEFFKHVRQPVIEIDATHPVFSGKEDGTYVWKLFEHLTQEIRRYKQPPRLTLDEWEAVDYNQAQEGMWKAQTQLRQYLREHQKIIAMAGPVGLGKTGFAQLLGQRLEIGVLRELDGSNDEIKDLLLDRFLRDKPRYCYDLQSHLIPKRTTARKELHAKGKSFVEDRSPVEDQSIFWRRFHEQGYLSDEQLSELKARARHAYADAPTSDLIIKLYRTPQECRKMILKRGRPQEVAAWPLSELRAMEPLYADFFEDMEQYGSHAGPKIEFNLQELDPKNDIHKGYIFQEIHHALLNWTEK